MLQHEVDSRPVRRDRSLVTVAASNSAVPKDYSGFELLDLEEIAANGALEPNWLLPQWIMEKDVALIAGTAGIGKSTTCSNLAVALARGDYWCGIPSREPVRVLLIDEEQDEATASRLLLRQDALAAYSSGMLQIAVGQGVRLDDEESYRRLERTIRQLRPQVVMMDSIQQLFGGVDENHSTGVGGIYRKLFRFRVLPRFDGHIRKGIIALEVSHAETEILRRVQARGC